MTQKRLNDSISQGRDSPAYKSRPMKNQASLKDSLKKNQSDVDQELGTSSLERNLGENREKQVFTSIGPPNFTAAE